MSDIDDEGSANLARFNALQDDTNDLEESHLERESSQDVKSSDPQVKSYNPFMTEPASVMAHKDYDDLIHQDATSPHFQNEDVAFDHFRDDDGDDLPANFAKNQKYPEADAFRDAPFGSAANSARGREEDDLDQGRTSSFVVDTEIHEIKLLAGDCVNSDRPLVGYNPFLNDDKQDDREDDDDDADLSDNSQEQMDHFQEHCLGGPMKSTGREDCEGRGINPDYNLLDEEEDDADIQMEPVENIQDIHDVEEEHLPGVVREDDVQDEDNLMEHVEEDVQQPLPSDEHIHSENARESEQQDFISDEERYGRDYEAHQFNDGLHSLENVEHQRNDEVHAALEVHHVQIECQNKETCDEEDNFDLENIPPLREKDFDVENQTGLDELETHAESEHSVKEEAECELENIPHFNEKDAGSVQEQHSEGYGSLGTHYVQIHSDKIEDYDEEDKNRYSSSSNDLGVAHDGDLNEPESVDSDEILTEPEKSETVLPYEIRNINQSLDSQFGVSHRKDFDEHESSNAHSGAPESGNSGVCDDHKYEIDNDYPSTDNCLGVVNQTDFEEHESVNTQAVLTESERIANNEMSEFENTYRPLENDDAIVKQEDQDNHESLGTERSSNCVEETKYEVENMCTSTTSDTAHVDQAYLADHEPLDVVPDGADYQKSETCEEDYVKEDGVKSNLEFTPSSTVGEFEDEHRGVSGREIGGGEVHISEDEDEHIKAQIVETSQVSFVRNGEESGDKNMIASDEGIDREEEEIDIADKIEINEEPQRKENEKQPREEEIDYIETKQELMRKEEELEETQKLERNEGEVGTKQDLERREVEIEAKQELDSREEKIDSKLELENKEEEIERKELQREEEEMDTIQELDRRQEEIDIVKENDEIEDRRSSYNRDFSEFSKVEQVFTEESNFLAKNADIEEAGVGLYKGHSSHIDTDIMSSEYDDRSFVDNLSELASPDTIPQPLPSPPEPKDISSFDLQASSETPSPSQEENDGFEPQPLNGTVGLITAVEVEGETKFGIDGTSITSTSHNLLQSDEDVGDDEECSQNIEQGGFTTTGTTETETSIDDKSGDYGGRGFEQEGNDTALMSMSMEGSFYDDGGELMGGEDRRNQQQSHLYEDGYITEESSQHDSSEPKQENYLVNHDEFGQKVLHELDQDEDSYHPHQESGREDEFDPLCNGIGHQELVVNGVCNGGLDSLLDAPVTEQGLQTPVTQHSGHSLGSFTDDLGSANFNDEVQPTGNSHVLKKVEGNSHDLHAADIVSDQVAETGIVDTPAHVTNKQTVNSIEVPESSVITSSANETKTTTTVKKPSAKAGAKTTTATTSTTTATTTKVTKDTKTANGKAAPIKKLETTTTTTSKPSPRKPPDYRSASAAPAERKTSPKTATPPGKSTTPTGPPKSAAPLPSYAQPIIPRKPREAKPPTPEEKKKKASTSRASSAAPLAARPQSVGPTLVSNNGAPTTKTSTRTPTSTVSTTSRTAQLARPKSSPTKLTNGVASSPPESTKSPTKKCGVDSKSEVQRPASGNMKITSERKDMKATSKVDAGTRTGTSVHTGTKSPTKQTSPQALASPRSGEIKSKIGSLENATHTPGGGHVKIVHKKPNYTNVSSKIGSKDNMDYKPGGGNVKIENRKIKVEAKSKIGSLENSAHKPGGGDKKNEKLDLKEKASNNRSIEQPGIGNGHSATELLNGSASEI